jgi:hypothetical protein
MASANVSEPLRWKRAKIHRGSRHRLSRRIRKPDIRQQLWPLILNMPNMVAIGRGPYTSTHGTSVWTGRAVQAGYDDLETIGLALLYPALEWSAFAPGHDGYPRASDLILGKRAKASISSVASSIRSSRSQSPTRSSMILTIRGDNTSVRFARMSASCRRRKRSPCRTGMPRSRRKLRIWLITAVRSPMRRDRTRWSACRSS